MFDISYTDWKSVCEMCCNLKQNTCKAYLQWFPFGELPYQDKKYICSEKFYRKYIQNPAVLLYSKTMYQTENFLQKTDGSFRESFLVSPLLYLLLQGIGKVIHDQYSSQRSSEISVYYAGSYEDKNMCASYKPSYDRFFKTLNIYAKEYKYFIKTDIANFFSNIKINKLISHVDAICNREKIAFPQMQLTLFKEILNYCGNGQFPLIENSVASSFLSTIVYLDDIDAALYKYISTKVKCICSFRMVRYVDDMYILFSSESAFEELHETYNIIKNEYSSILKGKGLALNMKKCCLKETTKLKGELKKSLYDRSFQEEKWRIKNTFVSEIGSFLDALLEELSNDSLDTERYNEIIDKYFSLNDMEVTPDEIFNSVIYESRNNLMWRNPFIVDKIMRLIKKNIAFITLDPKRLTSMILKTREEKVIKAFLAQLFKKDKNDTWNAYDTTITISYLVQRRFRHGDLLHVLNLRHPHLFQYYENYCRKSFIADLREGENWRLITALAQDQIAYYLYFMYLCEYKKGNFMTSFAYYKSYFDRVTADLAFLRNPKGENKPKYRKFYKKKRLCEFYEEFDDSAYNIIDKAQALRYANPLTHSSSELLSDENTSERLKQSIRELSTLLDRYIAQYDTRVNSSKLFC